MKENDDEDGEVKKSEYRRQRPIFISKNQKHFKNDQKESNKNVVIELPLKETNETTKASQNNNNVNKHRGKTMPSSLYNRANTTKYDKVKFKLPKHSFIQESKRKLSKLSKGAFYDSSRMFLSEQQKLYVVSVIKRNYDNNIYLNNTDQAISFVIPYKYKCPLFMFLLLGIPYIITFFSNKKLIEWRGEPCKFHEAKFYLIIDGYGNYHICNFTKKFFNTHFKSANRLKGFGSTKKHIPTLFSSVDFIEKEEYHEIMYVYNKYYCYKKINSSNYDINMDIKNKYASINSDGNEGNNTEREMYNNRNKDYYFEAPVFYLSSTTNNQIYEIFDNFFMEEDEIKFQLNVYGQNKLVLKVINFFTILFEKLISITTIYILFVSLFWWYERYFFSYVVLCLSIILLFFSAYQKYRNKKKVVDFSLNKQEKINVYEGRDKHSKLINYEDLVPGQIITLREEDVLCCDCLLLSGFCSCIESSLTGESASIMKYKLPNNSAIFKYSENQKSFLFCGTKIENCFPNELKALVIGTGFNTQRGNLIQSVLFPKKSNYNFYKENITYFIFIFANFVIGLILIIIFFDHNSKNYSKMLFKTILDLLTIAIPPTLPLSLTLGTFYYQYSLLNKNVSCSGEYRLMASGKINKLIFDKTGTLTEEDLELYGYISSVKKDGILILDSKESNSKLYLTYLFQYYKTVFHNKLMNQNTKINSDDSDNTITYFMECLATCHSVTKINDENKGNSIDIKIFNDVNWIYDSINIKAKANDQFEVKPKKYFKITEEQYFVNNSPFNKTFESNINPIEEKNSYKLKVIYRSHFESRNQSMSVLVKNNFNKSIRLYIKGAPEKIIIQCLRDSIPLNYDEIHRKYTLQGFRVLACATKLISEDSSNESDIICNEEYQNYKGNDLIFLGLILFQNKIKSHTKNVLQKLKDDGLFPIISTGDNAFTSISLVKECNLVKNYSKFCILDIETNNSSKDKNIYFNERPKLIPEQRENIILNCTFQRVNYYKPSKNDTSTCYVMLRKNNIYNENEYLNKIFRGKKRQMIQITELNNKLLEESDMKLCIHSHLFDFIFFRNKEGDEENTINEEANKINKKPGEGNSVEENEEIQLNLLRQIIVDKGILFFRMNPNDKTKLVQLFKKQNPNNIVAMCGDGANDCSALISADVGVSLKSRENIIMTSHFMAKTRSIKVINDILNIGKACYENSTIILKILLIYTEIKTTSRCLMKRKNENMTKNQYFYIDCIIILFGCCLMSTSDPNYENRKPAPSKLKINFFLLSIIGHTIFQITLLIIYFLVIIDVNEDDYNLIEERENDSIYSQIITPINSYVFFLNSVQCLSLVFIFNFFSVYKENLFKNRLFNLYLIIILLILSELISVENYKLGIFNYNLIEFINMKVRGMSSQTSRLVLFLFCCISFVGTFLWEFILNFINSNKFHECCNKKEKEREKSISNNDSFPIRKLKTSIGKRRSKTLNLRTSNMSVLTSKTINKK